ncbi:uncharacterized protein B0I36DRAFT_290568 [Microdochium trichocladiopsis]|uniref:Uncharacterized protein n=1 Tax=Microdochium trichocladiopsis TaxID=1682393 RepID=A0A9P9BPJ1_9PEZI|nr:uncharacterized protein B0I36DRAFT_290568 [Microdochium trichocladiopsis]KAH7029155.1 hypothetical protein B0I36DRAFT_290568 [Microdochium trichocladiopsis]
MTFENAELLHYYLRRVIPNLVSIDGETEPVVWKNNVLPWQLQSPLMPQIALLMAATTRGLERGTMKDTFAIKAKVLNCINAYLATSTPVTFQAVAAEAVGCIMSMVVTEWFWGSEEGMRAHHRGIKELIILCGGISRLNDAVRRSITVLTDYEIACGFEEDLCWQQGDPMYKQAWVVPISWPAGFDSPLVDSPYTFREKQAELGITSSAAAILDDVRFLTNSITALTSATPASKLKIQTTASWLHRRLKEASATEKNGAPDALAETVRLAGLVHSYSIMTITPFSQYPDLSVLAALSDAALRVPLTTWRDIPGIYLWVLLVLCPSTKADMRGKYIRRKMATTGLSIGFEDFIFSIGCLRSCWQVQRWIAHGGDTLCWLTGQTTEFD